MPSKKIEAVKTHATDAPWVRETSPAQNVKCMDRERFENMAVYVKDLTLCVLFPRRPTQDILNSWFRVVIRLNKL